MRERMPFERLAGLAAVVVALGALAYSFLFIAIVEGAGDTTREVWFFLLLLGGLGTLPVMAALYGRLQAVDPGLALTGLIFGVLAGFGGVLHGAYNLGGLITAPAGGYPPGPEEVSHGVLRYLMGGLALLVLSRLVQRSALFPASLAWIGFLGGAALVFIYIGRLFDFITPGDYVSLIPPILYGFVLHPLWYAWLGRELWRGPSAELAPTTP